MISNNNVQNDVIEFSNWSDYNIFSKFVSIITLNFNNIKQMYMFVYKGKKISDIFDKYPIFMKIIIIGFAGSFIWDFIGLNLILFRFENIAVIINLVLIMVFIYFIVKYKKENYKINKILWSIFPLGSVPLILYLTYFMYAQCAMLIKKLENPFSIVMYYRIPKNIFISSKIYPFTLIVIFSLVTLILIKINSKN